MIAVTVWLHFTIVQSNEPGGIALSLLLSSNHDQIYGWSNLIKTQSKMSFSELVQRRIIPTILSPKDSPLIKNTDQSGSPCFKKKLKSLYLLKILKRCLTIKNWAACETIKFFYSGLVSFFLWMITFLQLSKNLKIPMTIPFKWKRKKKKKSLRWKCLAS